MSGISKLTQADLRTIADERAKDRPTSWANLALRFGVNELDLRGLFDPENDNAPKAPAPAPALGPKAQRDARFAAMWIEGVPVARMREAFGLSEQKVRAIRNRLCLEPRTAGRPKAIHNQEDAA
jgi:hypothetical protein